MSHFPMEYEQRAQEHLPTDAATGRFPATTSCTVAHYQGLWLRRGLHDEVAGGIEQRQLWKHASM